MKSPNQKIASQIPTPALLEEIERRRNNDKSLDNKIAWDKIKRLANKRKLILGCEYYKEEYMSNRKHYEYVLGIIEKGKFKDFYYNSGLEYEDFGQFVPNGFSESMESTYETKKSLQESLDILKACGYSYFKEINY